MASKKSFWQELILQAIAPFMALMGVVVGVRPDLLGPSKPDICTQITKTTSIARDFPDELIATGDDKAPPDIPFDVMSYDISIAHLGLAIAAGILIVQIIRLLRNIK